MTRLLVEGGANLDAVDVNGNGVVHAAVCDSPAVLAILIDNGADVTVPNHDGLTPKVRSGGHLSFWIFYDLGIMLEFPQFEVLELGSWRLMSSTWCSSVSCQT